MDIFKFLQIVVQRMDKSETISENWIGLKGCFSSVDQVAPEEAGGLVIRISCFTNSIIHITPTCCTNNIFAAKKKTGFCFWYHQAIPIVLKNVSEQKK